MAAPAIGARRRWAPPPSARPDWSHPLVPGCGWIPSMGMQSLHGDPVTPTDTPLPVPKANKFGFCVETASSGSTRKGAGWPNRIIGSRIEMTFMWAGTTTFGGNTGMSVLMTRSKGISATGLYNSSVYWNDDPSTWGYNSGNPLSSSLKEQTLIGVKTAADIRLYIDGVASGVNTTALGAIDFSSLTGATAWTTFDPAGGSMLEGYSTCYYIWPRALAPAEMAAILADPFCFMRS